MTQAPTGASLRLRVGRPRRGSYHGWCGGADIPSDARRGAERRPADGGDDAALVSLAARGDQEALAALHERYAGRVYDFVYRLVRDPKEAAAQARASLIAVLGRLDPDEGAHLRGRLFAEARERALTGIEARGEMLASHPMSDEESRLAGFDALRPANLSDPGLAGLDRSAVRAVWRAASSLPPWQYAVLDLGLRQNLDRSALAEALGAAPGDADATLAAARRDIENAAARDLAQHGAGAEAASDLFAALGPAPLPVEVKNATWRALVGDDGGTTSSRGTADEAAPASLADGGRTIGATRPEATPWQVDDTRVPATLARPVRLRGRAGTAERLPLVVAAVLLLVLGLTVGLLSGGPGALVRPFVDLAASASSRLEGVRSVFGGADAGQPAASRPASIALAAPATPEPTSTPLVAVLPTSTPLATLPTATPPPPSSTPVRQIGSLPTASATPPSTPTSPPASPTAGTASPTAVAAVKPQSPSDARPAAATQPSPTATRPPATTTPSPTPTVQPTPTPVPPTNTPAPPPTATRASAPAGHVPNVVGMPESQARAAIDAAGYNNTYSNYQGPGDVPPSVLQSVPVGAVLSQNPAGGSAAAPGTTVYLAVRKA